MGSGRDAIEALAESYRDWLGGDEALARELALAVLPEIPGHLERISDAIDARDAAELRAAAHRLKGALGVFGEHPAFDLAQQLESAGRTGRMDEALALKGPFEAAVDTFSRAAEALTRRLMSGR